MPTPTAQFLSRTVYTTDGVTTFWDFSFTGGYLDGSHVKAYTVTSEGIRTELAGVTLVGPYQIKVSPALAAGATLVIYRDTPKDLPLVDFTDESGFSEISLDTNAKQAVFIAAETLDALDFTPDAAASASATAAANSALAAAGSALAAELSAASINTANLVNTSTNQTVSGTKTFSNPIQGSVTGSAGTAGTPFAQTLLTATTSAQARATMGISAASGSADVGYTPAGTGAVATTVQDKLRESVSVFVAMTDAQKADVLAGTYLLDVTASINVAISIAAVLGKELFVPAGGYLITPSTPLLDETGGMNTCAFPMTSDMHIRAEKGATFKVANNVSTDASPKLMSMFFSNQFLNNISICGLTMDMNGANNNISPNRGALSFNRYTQAHILFSGTPGGVAAGANNVLIEECRFLNTAGVTCIGMAQSNSAGVTMGSGWKLLNNSFENNGLDTDDHSSVFGWANDVDAVGNTFKNPAMYNNATHTGGLVAYEIHGSNTKFAGNTIENYYQGLWLSINLTDTARNINVYGNKAKVSCCFSDFYAANLTSGPSPEQAIQGVNIYGNAIDITSDAVADDIKVFFRIAARRQPSMVNIYGNICRSFETAKNTVLASVVVSPDQLAEANSINIHDNTAAGLNLGLAVFFGAAFNIGAVSFENNKLGNLVPSPGPLYVNRDVYLYGIAAGTVASLRLGGLETPVSPVGTDSAVGGRATVYGKALLDLPVTWSGVTIGAGSYSKKIAIDTDAGHATVDVGFIAGASTTYSGNIGPTISGLVADASASATATHVKTGSALPLSSLIFNTASSISLYTASGALFDSSQTNTSSYVFVNANFPCRYASI